MRVGFACVWDRDARRTWSYTPWELRAALRRVLGDDEVVDVGIVLPDLARLGLRTAALRRRDGRWVTPWEHLPPWERASAAHIGRQARRKGCDAVLQIQDLGVIDTPYYVYQDLSYDVVLELLDQGSDGLRQYFPHLDRSAVLRRRERQLEVYAGAAGVLAMSQYLARHLVEVTGLDPAKVHTLLPGAVPSASGHRIVDPDARPAPRRRLLFVGTTFWVKGGDTVVEALARLRRDHDPEITLTLVGPDQWPLPGPIPDGVRFLGRLDAAEVSALYDAHDLLVVPSRLEGFGKVFVEALSRGLPCIGRDAFAMSELIRPGVNGDLVTSEDPAELVERIVTVLGDDAIYASCAGEASSVQQTFTWDRAARTFAQILEGATPPG